MRHVVAEELKNDMINYRMFTGCILIIVVALLSRIDMFQKLIEFGNSPEGPDGIRHIDIVCMHIILF